jgi:membrane protease YdiL (CAAX protease family)
MTSVLLVVGAEVLFRGWIYADLVRGFGAPVRGRLWPLSVPLWLSGLLFALVSLFPGLGFGALIPDMAMPWGLVLDFAIGFGFGITLGGLRERSESLLPPVLAHLMCYALFQLLAPRWPWISTSPW